MRKITNIFSILTVLAVGIFFTVGQKLEAASDKKVLVAYFSGSGNTKDMGQKIANSITGKQVDVFEIIPEVAYTAEELASRDRNVETRITKEQNDSSARPKIKGTIPNMADYDIIFLGYPVWFSKSPRVVNTFLESANFSGKTIITFGSSGGNREVQPTEDIKPSAPNATWIDGKRFARGISQEDIKTWVESLNIK